MTKLGLPTGLLFPRDEGFTERELDPPSSAADLRDHGPSKEAPSDLALLRKDSLSARYQEKKTLKQGQAEQSLRSLELLPIFLPKASPEKLNMVLKALALGIQEGKKIRDAFQGLATEDREFLQENLGEDKLRNIFSIAENVDPKIFWDEILHWGISLKLDRDWESAGALLSWMASQAPADLRLRAQAEYGAVVGQGSVGLRSEVLLAKLSQDATDYRTVVPMLASGMVFDVIRTASLARLATPAVKGWLNSPWAARAIAGMFGFGGEVATFSLSNRALQQWSGENVAWDTESVGKDLLSSTLSLGALKIFGMMGNQAFLKLHGISEMGVATQLQGWTKLSQVLIPQTAMFGGMLASHTLETQMGLRKKVDDATFVTDTLSSMLSMGVGAHLGHAALGPRFAEFQREMGHRAGIYEEKIKQRDVVSTGNFGKTLPLHWGAAGIGATLLFAPEIAHASVQSPSHPSSLATTALLSGLSALVMFGMRRRSSPPAGIEVPIYDSINSYSWRAPTAETNQVYDAEREKDGEQGELLRLHQEAMATGIGFLFDPQKPFEEVIAHLYQGQPLIRLGQAEVFESQRWGPVDLRPLAQTDPLKYYPGNVRQAELFRDLGLLLNQANPMVRRLRGFLGSGADQFFLERHWNTIPIPWQHLLWLQHRIDFSQYQGYEGYAQFAQEHFESDPHRAWMAVRPLFESLREMKAQTAWPMMKKNHLDREPELRRELIRGLQSGNLIGETGYDLFSTAYFEGDARLAWNAARTLLTAEGFRRLQWPRHKTTNVFSQDALRQILRGGIADASFVGEAGYDEFAKLHFKGYSQSAWAAARTLLGAEEFAKLGWNPKVTRVQDQEAIRDFLRKGLEDGVLIGEAGYDRFAQEFFNGCSSSAWRAAKTLLQGENFAKLRWRPKATYLHEEGGLREALREGLRTGEWFGEKGLELYAQQFWSGDPTRAWDVARSVLTEVEFLLLAWEHRDNGKEGLEREGGNGFAALSDYLLNQKTPPLELEVVQRFLRLLAAKPHTLGKRLLRLIQNQRIGDLGLQILSQWFEKIIEEIPHVSRRLPESEEDSKKTKDPSAPPGSKPPPSTPEPLRFSATDLEEIRKTLESLAKDPHGDAEFLFELVEATVGENPGVQLLIAYLKEHLKRVPRAKKGPSEPPSGTGDPKPVGDPPTPTGSEPIGPEPTEGEPPLPPQVEPVDASEASNPSSDVAGPGVAGDPPKLTEPESKEPNPSEPWSPMDQTAWEAMKLPPDLLWDYPELELVLGRLNSFSLKPQHKAKTLSPEGKALLALLVLWTERGDGLSPRAQKIIQEMRRHLESSAAPSIPLTELLKRAFSAHQAVRMEILNKMTLDKIVGLLPELRIGGHPMMGFLATEAFLAHFFSRRVPKAIFGDWLRGIKKLRAEIGHKTGPVSEADVPRVLQEIIRSLVRYYLENREDVLKLDPIPIEEWEKKSYRLDEMPDKVRAEILQEFPESELVREEDLMKYVVGSKLSPSRFKLFRTLFPFFTYPSLDRSYAAVEQKKAKPLGEVVELKIISTEHQFLGEAGFSEPNLEKRLMEVQLDLYRKIRPHYLTHLARSQEIGLDRLLAVFPEYAREVETPAIPELTTLRAQGAQHLPEVFRLMQATSSPSLEPLIERMLWEQNPFTTSETPQGVEKKSAEFAGRIRKFTLERFTDLIKNRESADEKPISSRVVEIEGRSRKDIEALWEFFLASKANLEEFRGFLKEPLGDYNRLTWLNFFRTPEYFKKFFVVMISRLSWPGLAGFKKEIMAEPPKAAALILMGADPAWVNAILAKRILKLYQTFRGQVLAQIDCINFSSQLPEVIGFPETNFFPAVDALAQKLAAEKPLQFSEIWQILKKERDSARVYGLLRMAETQQPGWLAKYGKETKIKFDANYYNKCLMALHRFYLEHRRKILPLLPDFGGKSVSEGANPLALVDALSGSPNLDSAPRQSWADLKPPSDLLWKYPEIDLLAASDPQGELTKPHFFNTEGKALAKLFALWDLLEDQLPESSRRRIADLKASLPSAEAPRAAAEFLEKATALHRELRGAILSELPLFDQIGLYPEVRGAGKRLIGEEAMNAFLSYILSKEIPEPIWRHWAHHFDETFEAYLSKLEIKPEELRLAQEKLIAPIFGYFLENRELLLQMDSAIPLLDWEKQKTPYEQLPTHVRDRLRMEFPETDLTNEEDFKLLVKGRLISPLDYQNARLQTLWTFLPNPGECFLKVEGQRSKSLYQAIQRTTSILHLLKVEAPALKMKMLAYLKDEYRNIRPHYLAHLAKSPSIGLDRVLAAFPELKSSEGPTGIREIDYLRGHGVESLAAHFRFLQSAHSPELERKVANFLWERNSLPISEKPHVVEGMTAEFARQIRKFIRDNFAELMADYLNPEAPSVEARLARQESENEKGLAPLWEYSLDTALFQASDDLRDFIFSPESRLKPFYFSVFNVEKKPMMVVFPNEAGNKLMADYSQGKRISFKAGIGPFTVEAKNIRTLEPLDDYYRIGLRNFFALPEAQRRMFLGMMNLSPSANEIKRAFSKAAGLVLMGADPRWVRANLADRMLKIHRNRRNEIQKNIDFETYAEELPEVARLQAEQLAELLGGFNPGLQLGIGEEKFAAALQRNPLFYKVYALIRLADAQNPGMFARLLKEENIKNGRDLVNNPRAFFRYYLRHREEILSWLQSNK